MTEIKSFSDVRREKAVSDLIQTIDRDVERGEDILMLGFAIVMMSSFFAIIVPPSVLLPIVAFIFALSASVARINYHKMQRKLSQSVVHLDELGRLALQPITNVFLDHPKQSLTDTFNPLKNMKKTWKCALGGIVINPLWFFIFYTMGIQISEEKKLVLLNRAIFEIERQPVTAMSIVA